MAETLNAIADVTAESAPLEVRLGKSLDEIDERLGFRRSAVIYYSRGAAPVLLGHARGSSDEFTFVKDMRNVQFILSNTGERGVVRSALDQGSSITLNDVTRDSRYVAADDYSSSEACLVEALSDTSSIALNVESSTPWVFTNDEIDFLTSVADLFAMTAARNESLLLNLQSAGSQGKLHLAGAEQMRNRNTGSHRNHLL